MHSPAHHRSPLLPLLLLAIAAAGIALAVEAFLAGSLLRYVLVGQALGIAACTPLLLWCLGGRGRRLLRNLVFVAVPLLAALGLLELGLRLFGPAMPPPLLLLPHPRLGHVVAPGTGGTDRDGFRNAPPADEAPLAVLFVGDSQTWGFGVDATATFSQLAARDLGRTRQLANGGYGPVQYVELVQRGLAQRPGAVVIGFYFGNDLLDATDYAALVGAEALRTERRSYTLRRHRDLDGARAPNWAMALVDEALLHSRVLALAAGGVKARLQGGLLDRQPGAVTFEDDRVPTILLPGYRLPTVDPRSDAVQDGLAVTARALVAIRRQCATAGARSLLLLIPTKEFCYAEWCRRAGRERPELTALWQAESACRQAMLATAAAAGIDVHDLAADCIAALDAGQRPWPAGGDGHLNAHGHALAAAAVVAWLGR
ncbi:MAG: hypothetical protein MUC36_12750 [Planctomycetes bacterium]|nr:hypothetical protein [Planctomycetota bacterium]